MPRMRRCRCAGLPSAVGCRFTAHRPALAPHQLSTAIRQAIAKSLVAYYQKCTSSAFPCRLCDCVIGIVAYP